jgi:hypothetical protein
MAIYEASGLTTAPAATIDASYCQLWNTSATQRLQLREFGLTLPVGTAEKVAIKRTTARGTNTTTVLGTSRETTGTGVGTLDLTYSVDSTKTGLYFRRAHLPAVIGAGLLWTWWSGSGLTVQPSAGLAFVVPTAVVGIVSEVWAVWEE